MKRFDYKENERKFLRALLISSLYYYLIPVLGGTSIADSASEEVPGGTAGTAYYISPDGNNAAPGTLVAPWQTFRHAIPHLNPGDALVLLDGEYAPETTGMPYIDCGVGGNAKNGTASSPITIKAQNERQAFLNSRGVNYWGAFAMQNCSYWNVEGLHGEAGDNPRSTNNTFGTVFQLRRGSHISFKKLLGAYNDRYKNSHIYGIEDSQNILLEECEAYYFHRHAFSIWQSHDVALRRCYANSRGHPDLPGCSLTPVVGQPRCSSNSAGGDSAYTFYGSSDSIAENCISENRNLGFTSIGGRTFDGFPGGWRNQFLGDISIGDNSAAKVEPRADTSTGAGAYWEAHDNVFRDFLVLNTKDSAGIVYLKSSYNTLVAHGTFIGNANSFGLVATEDSDIRCSNLPSGCSAVIHSSLALNNAREGFYGANQNKGFLVESSNAYGNSGGKVTLQYYPTDDPSDASGSIQHSSMVVPSGVGMNGCLAYIPVGSNMKGAGKGGADIGANILYRYENGTLTNIPLWDIRTGAFPCGSAVSGMNDIPGDSCFDVYKRLNVNGPDCPLPYLEKLAGDLSGDGKVTAYDAALVAQYVVGLIPDTQVPTLCNELTAEEFRHQGDVDGVAGLSANDAMLIAKRAVGLIEKFPVEGS